jgi:hypothetical protein
MFPQYPIPYYLFQDLNSHQSRGIKAVGVGVGLGPGVGLGSGIGVGVGDDVDGPISTVMVEFFTAVLPA